MIRTFVINLERSPERKEAIGSRLTQLGIPFDWVLGTDGHKLTRSDLSAYSSREAFAVIGREMHRNEIGCILSHIGIWQAMVRDGIDEAMVVEDDMLIDDDFGELIADLAWVPADASVVNFSWDMATPVPVRAINPRRTLCQFDREVMRTGTYILRREGAERLLRNAFPVRMPADSLIGNSDHVGRIYGVTPRPVRWNDKVPSDTWTDSTMDGFTRASRSTLKGKFLRILNRLRS